MTEIQPYTAPSLESQMNFARALAVSNLLPNAYRQQPGNVLVAIGLGQAMGLSPAESLYRINVIQGKPTASAELIASNVRKAGHRLRVKQDKANMSVTAMIVRSDDPDFEFVETRDMQWAKDMGLANNDNYKKQPLTLLTWRAITAVARVACPEALYGTVYTPDEMYDLSGGTPAPAPDEQPYRGIGGVLSQAAQKASDPYTPIVVTGPQSVSEPDDPIDMFVPIAPAQSKLLHTLFTKAGITDRAERLAICTDQCKRAVTTSSELSRAEASVLIDYLNTLLTDRENGDTEPDRLPHDVSDDDLFALPDPQPGSTAYGNDPS